jgi:hypothetical protein
MSKTVHCKWRDRLLSAKRAYRCPICGHYVCADCWGLRGDICIVCLEQSEVLDDEDDDEEECEDEDDCDDYDCDDCDEDK